MNDKFKNFLKIGLSVVAISAAFSSNALAHNDHLTNSAESIATATASSAATNVTNKFDVNHFIKKYNLENLKNNSKIHIKPIYIKDGQPISWTYSTASRNEDGSQDVVLILDSKGDLYGINDSFTGKNSLNQKEKNLLKEHTLLHELSHADTSFEAERFQSSKLSTQDNKDINDTLIVKMNGLGLGSVLNESNAAANATALLIKYNSDSFNDISSLIHKKNVRDETASKKALDNNIFDSHMMIPQVEKTIVNQHTKIKKFSNEEVSLNSKIVASDATLDYLHHYGKAKLYTFQEGSFNLTELLNDKVMVSADLLNSIQYIAQKNSGFSYKDVSLFNQHATNITNKYPQLSSTRILGGPGVVYTTPQSEIISENTNTPTWMHTELLVRKSLPNKAQFDIDFKKSVDDIINDPQSVNAKNIVTSFVNHIPYHSLDSTHNENVLTKSQPDQIAAPKVQLSTFLGKISSVRNQSFSNSNNKLSI